MVDSFRLSGLLLAVTALGLSPAVRAGDEAQPPDARAREAVTASATIPNLSPWVGDDGEPGPAAWRHAAHFSLDNEINPGRNVPAPVQTTVAVGYTQEALWLHFVARDPRPDRIRAKFRRHDQVSGNADFVGVYFNPFNNTQWGYAFLCSAAGIMEDAFRQQGRAYESFDAIWYCEATLTPYGYTVTMEIPFSSLKFPDSPRPQTWRLLFVRNWPRNVRHRVTQVAFDFSNRDCLLCQAQVVRTATPIRAEGAELLLIPSVTLSRTAARANPSAGLEPSNPEATASLGVRWAIRPNLELSATFNPDFSQVAPAVLRSRVNERFAIFYPENRPFFEDGAWVFKSPGFNLVDTRQIANPGWASKLVGHIGNHAIGVLIADDAITNILLPGQQSSQLRSFDFSTLDMLLRYRYDFIDNSTLGVLATSRQGAGYKNRVLALDGHWQITSGDSLTLQTAYSSTTYPPPVAEAFGIAPGSVSGGGWELSFDHKRSRYQVNVSLEHVDPGFRSDLGFMPQVGYTEVDSHFEVNWYSDSDWWNNVGFGGGWEWVQAAGGGPVLNRELQFYVFYHGVAQSHVILSASHEELTFQGHVFSLRQVFLHASSRPFGWLSFGLTVNAGDGVDYTNARKGRLLSIGPFVTLKPGRHLRIRFVGDYERLDVAGRRLYTAKIYDLRVSWHFNAKTFLRVIVQGRDVRRNLALYPSGTDGRTRTLATQWLFGYEINPWTSLYAGFGNNYRGLGEAGLLAQHRTLFVKMSYALQF